MKEPLELKYYIILILAILLFTFSIYYKYVYKESNAYSKNSYQINWSKYAETNNPPPELRKINATKDDWGAPTLINKHISVKTNECFSHEEMTKIKT